MRLTRAQFDILSNLAKIGTAPITGKTGSDKNFFPKAEASTKQELTELGLLSKSGITERGIQTLEPYRVKRAIFMAAGIGSRLSPVTINTPKPLVRVHGIRIIDRLIDACLAAGIDEIYIVRGYLAEQFDALLYKYPMLKFLNNSAYREANNISSVLTARFLLSNGYVLESDLLLSNPEIISRYHYSSDFLAIRKKHTEDWCFEEKGGIITEEKVGGTDCWQMVGISYWNEEDGKRLAEDLAQVYALPGGKDRYWEQVPLCDCREHYRVAIRECFDEDVVEIDTFDELKAIDKAYDVQKCP